jgi:hypothetical protein
MVRKSAEVAEEISSRYISIFPTAFPRTFAADQDSLHVVPAAIVRLPSMNTTLFPVVARVPEVEGGPAI